MEELLDRSEAGSPDIPRDTLWVYENIENPKTLPSDAPSVGAWGLLNWARGNRGQVLFHSTPQSEDDNSQSNFGDAGNAA